MSDTAEAEPAAETAEVSTNEAAESPQVVDTHELNKGNKPAGYDPVDLSDLPPEKQKVLDDRISYLYRQVKDSGRTLGEYRTIAQQQAAKIDELMNGMGVVVDYLGNKSTEQQVEDLRKQGRAAFDKGDLDGYERARDAITDLKMKQATKPATQKQQQSTQQQQIQNPQQIAHGAVESGELAPQDATYVSAWQEERDTTGAPLRPWAHDSDPNYRAALLETASVFNNPGFAKMSFQDKLAEVDRRMGVKKSNGGQSVMGGGLQTPRKNGTIRLTPNQERIATRMKFAGPGKSDAEHLAAYRKQIDSVQSKNQRSR